VVNRTSPRYTGRFGPFPYQHRLTPAIRPRQGKDSALIPDQRRGIGKEIAALRCVELVENVDHIGDAFGARRDDEHPEWERERFPELGVALEFVADVVLRIGLRAKAQPHAAAIRLVEEMIESPLGRPVEMMHAKRPIGNTAAEIERRTGRVDQIRRRGENAGRLDEPERRVRSAGYFDRNPERIGQQGMFERPAPAVPLGLMRRPAIELREHLFPCRGELVAIRRE
jgi:hypothetical protein